MHSRLGVLLILLAGSLGPRGGRALAEPEPPKDRFVHFAPLSLDQLYAKRMRFTEGEPMISVGIMEGQTSVTLRADGPTRLMLDEGDLPKTVYAPPESTFVLKPLEGKKAVLRYWVVVETRPYADAEGAEQSEAAWKARGYPTKTFEVGTIVALRGNVLDTRVRRVAVGAYATEAQAERVVRALSAKEDRRAVVHHELVEAPSGVIGVFDERGRLVHRAKNTVYFGTVENGLIEVMRVEHSRGYRSHGHQNRKFWGHIYVAVGADAKLSVINSVGAERLLGGLVPAEIFPTAPLEALKAQAVTARGEIFSKLGHRHFGEPYHLCSEQHCQVYAGAGFEREATSEAVRETRGFLAVRPRAAASGAKSERNASGGPASEKETMSLVDSVYSSTCGGFSEANEVVWSDAASDSLRARLDGSAQDPALAAFAGGLDEGSMRTWLESYPPTECARSSFVRPDKFRWKKRLSAAELDLMVKGYEIGWLKDVKVLGRGKGGRVTGVRLVGTRGEADVLREFPVRRLFGNLHSGMFVMELERGRGGRLHAITFIGGGWGHGVGMCQVGAIGRAERGQSFREILAHYYSGAVVEQVY